MYTTLTLDQVYLTVSTICATAALLMITFASWMNKQNGCDVTEKPSIHQRSRRRTSFHACKPNKTAQNEIPRGLKLLLVTTHRLLTQLSK